MVIYKMMVNGDCFFFFFNGDLLLINVINEVTVTFVAFKLSSLIMLQPTKY